MPKAESDPGQMLKKEAKKLIRTADKTFPRLLRLHNSFVGVLNELTEHQNESDNVPLGRETLPREARRLALHGRVALAGAGFIARGALPLTQLIYRQHRFTNALEDAGMGNLIPQAFAEDDDKPGLYEVAEQISGQQGELNHLLEGLLPEEE